MMAEKPNNVWTALMKAFATLRVTRRTDLPSALKIEEKLSLGPKKTLYLVHCKGRDLVVATGCDSIVSVTELSLVEVIAAKPRPRLQKSARLS